jgi:hypothetical protein
MNKQTSSRAVNKFDWFSAALKWSFSNCENTLELEHYRPIWIKRLDSEQIGSNKGRREMQ